MHTLPYHAFRYVHRAQNLRLANDACGADDRRRCRPGRARRRRDRVHVWPGYGRALHAVRGLQDLARGEADERLGQQRPHASHLALLLVARVGARAPGLVPRHRRALRGARVHRREPGPRVHRALPRVDLRLPCQPAGQHAHQDHVRPHHDHRGGRPPDRYHLRDGRLHRAHLQLGSQLDRSHDLRVCHRRVRVHVVQREDEGQVEALPHRRSGQGQLRRRQVQKVDREDAAHGLSGLSAAQTNALE
mmetsp:Transcript_4956/g.12165  ORF Transcript_4956/g.12165 Transcript_4956/m.12165 type:complete len:247 (+) Transcript_4956:599-1339(+)